MNDYIGIDIIEISRIKGVIDRRKDTFLRRVFTEKELQLCQRRLASLAARFAGKEAVFKALGVKGKGVSWKDIEILAGPGGKPLVLLHRKARSHSSRLGLDLAISLSHSRDYAAAFVVGERKTSK